MLQPLLKKRERKVKQISSFLSRMSTLLHEGYTFSDTVSMLLPYHVENIDYWNGLVQEKLRNGSDVVDILQSFTIPNYYLVAIKIAEENGELSTALNNVAKQMEFNEKIRSKFVSLLSYPIMLLIFLTGIFLAFRSYFLPNIEQIIESRVVNDNHSSLNLSKLFLHIPDFLFLSGIFLVFLIFVLFKMLKKQTIEKQISILLSMPLINYFYKLQITRQVARLLGSLLASGFSLQHSLNILQQQQLNQHLSFISAELEKRIIHGESLANAIFMSPYFFSKFEEFIKHGEKSGYLGRELLIYCELLDEKLQMTIKRSLSIIQPLFFIGIAGCIIAAYLSILLPMYNLIEIF